LHESVDIDAYTCIISCMSKPVSISEQLPCMNLSYRKASRVISQIYDRELAEMGLKCTQFSILSAVRYMKQTTNAELQELLVLEQTTLTRGLKPLIRDGYIKIEPGRDKREKLLSLTVEGKNVFKQANKKWQQAQDAIVRKLGRKTSEQMLEMNQALVALKP
jgi:MarR family transcriptional regulator for hemolysin